MQLLKGERSPLYINGHGIENISNVFEDQCLIALEEVKHLWPVVRCE